jgi:hypothetical protein
MATREDITDIVNEQLKLVRSAAKTGPLDKEDQALLKLMVDILKADLVADVQVSSDLTPEEKDALLAAYPRSN